MLAQGLGALTKLQTLLLGGITGIGRSSCSAEGMASLAVQFPTVSLKKLTLPPVCDGSGCGASRAPCLGALTALHTLSMSHCRIGDEGARAIASVLKKLIFLTCLNMCANDLNCEGAKTICSLIPSLVSLKAIC